MNLLKIEEAMGYIAKAESLLCGEGFMVVAKRLSNAYELVNDVFSEAIGKANEVLAEMDKNDD